MSKFCDLNLNATRLSNKDLNELVEFALKLGYDNLALSIDFEFPEIKKKDGKESQQQKSGRQQVQFPAPVNYLLPENILNQLKRCCRKVIIQKRINIKVNDGDIATNLHHLRNKDLQKFDLIAIKPDNNNVLSYMCTNNYNIDIISIESGISCGLTDQHLVKPIRNAIDSFGISFELNYSPALSSSINRRDFIMLGRALAFNTKSKSLILSSSASDPMQLRAPTDLLVIAKLFDINHEQAHKLIRYNPFNTILKSFCRQHTAAGVVYFNESKDIEKFKKILIMMKSQTNESSIKISSIDDVDEKMEGEVDEEDKEENKATKRKLID